MHAHSFVAAAQAAVVVTRVAEAVFVVVAVALAVIMAAAVAVAVAVVFFPAVGRREVVLEAQAEVGLAEKAWINV